MPHLTVSRKFHVFAATLACSVGASNASAQTPSLKDRLLKTPQVVAHQGGAFRVNPNTLEAFKEAIAEGSDVIETDLRLTKDGIPVIFHDERLQKNTNCHGHTTNLTFAEIRKCKYKKHSDAIPSFDELLTMSAGRFVINAEFKTDDVVKPALDVLKKHQASEWVMFQTQPNRKRYQLARTYDRNAYLLFSPDNSSDIQWIKSLNDPKLLVVELHPKFNQKALINEIKATGKLVTENAFYVSPDEEKTTAGCTRLLEFGFNMMVTDQPKSCVQQRNAFIK